MGSIMQISDHTAHLVLIALCEDGLVKRKALKLIEKNKDAQKKGNGTKRNGTKRKVRDEDLLVCEQCQSFYTEEENSDMACRFHDGE